MIITLPSDASRADYPDNDQHTFTVNLDNAVNLAVASEYEIGLSEIHLSTLIANVRQRWIRIDPGSERQHGLKLYVAEGYCKSIFKLQEAVQCRISAVSEHVKILVNEETRSLVASYRGDETRIE